MSISYGAWCQIKSITAQELMSALGRDQWTCDTSGGSMHIYRKNGARVSIHYHPKKTYGEKMLKALLEDIGWDDADLRRLKVI